LLKDTLPDDAGIIFYIDEPAMGFVDRSTINGVPFSKINLATKLPYNNFVLHFSDCFVTYSLKLESASSFVLTCDSLAIWKHGAIGPLHISVDAYLYYVIDSESLTVTSIGIISKFTDDYKCFTEEEIMEEEPYSKGIYFFLLCRFLSFMACKNVSVDDVLPPEKLQRRRRKKNKPPLVSYHILKLKNIGKSYCAGENTGQWSNRVHLCRGHVREYTQDRPLFGKFTGRFWIHPHVRGKRSLGVVQKDYALCTEQN